MGLGFNALRISASFAVLAIAPSVMAVSATPEQGQAAVLFNPSLERRELMIQVAHSGADLVRFGGAPGLVVVELPDDGPAALRRAGAWLVMDPIVMGGCAATPQQTSS
jgi:hypothetical protein